MKSNGYCIQYTESQTEHNATNYLEHIMRRIERCLLFVYIGH